MGFEYDKSKKYILACSFGPDSMALFHMLYSQGYQLIVCHVNYHKRAESNFEQQSLQSYCAERGVPLYVLDTEGMEHKGNFQAWARNARYDFFKKIYDKLKVDGLFIAHNEDDLLETYLMQVNRKMIIPFYGIAYETTLKDMHVLRPLLDVPKASLQEYCNFHQVPYSLDSSNFKDDYTRNEIRHHVLSKFTIEERKEARQKIEVLNARRALQMDDAKKLFINETSISINDLLKAEPEIQLFALYSLVEQNCHFYELSKKRVNEILKVCESKKPNVKVFLTGAYYFVKEYDVLSIKDFCSIEGYKYIVAEPCRLDTPYFEMDFSNNSDNRNVFDYDYPLTIRSYTSGDSIIINGVERKIRRLFIDWKMPLALRERWPIILNKEGKIIYVPRYQKNFKKTSETNFVVKF